MHAKLIHVHDIFMTLKLVNRPDEVFRFRSPRPREKVIERLVRDYQERHGQPVTFTFEEDAVFDYGVVRWSPTGESVSLIVSAPLGRDLTFGRLEDAFGEELHDPTGPASIEITYSGGEGSAVIGLFVNEGVAG